ncbi:MAG TPA: hypothetical protein VFS20_13305 [Longimicrobium sp.]|nr:hypothetical protein [Longimicrobium sp.]
MSVVDGTQAPPADRPVVPFFVPTGGGAIIIVSRPAASAAVVEKCG